MEKLFTIFLLLPLLLIAGCSKHEPLKPTCQRVYYLSDRYTLDTFYIRTDTLWPFGELNNVRCGSDTLRLINDSIPYCIGEELEMKRWVIGNKITKPYIFK